MNPISNIMPKLLKNIDLTTTESEGVFKYLISGQASDIEMSAFLSTLSMKGSSSDELAGAAKSLFPYVTNPLKLKIETIDIVGTGGDGLNTYNISTAVAFIVASYKKVYVAKHGNTAVSSKSGASDVLSELGINISINDVLINKCLEKTNICFLFAPNYNKAFKYVAKVRKELIFRTIFNLLGPLLNPVRPKRQLLGVFSNNYVLTVAKTLKALNSEKAWVVNGVDGMDEITLTGVTKVAELNNNQINEFEINPTKYGFKLCNQEKLKGGTPTENAKKMLNLFKGEKGHYRDIVLLNSAAAFCISGSVKNLEEGIDLANQLIDNGMVLETLQNLIKITNE